MEEKENPLNLRSDELQDIMSKSPAWVVRWGISARMLLPTNAAVWNPRPRMISARVVSDSFRASARLWSPGTRSAPW